MSYIELSEISHGADGRDDHWYERVNLMKTVALKEVKSGLSKYLRLAAKEEVVITRHGKPAGISIGLESDDDWFDYRLEHDPRSVARIERARLSLRAGQGTRLEDLKE